MGGPVDSTPGTAASAVLVTVPSAEPVVGAHRARLDASARLGVPAHVTVLFPFLAPGDIDAGVLAALAEAVATVPRFEAVCAATGWFGTEVLWLDPQPAAGFEALTAAVTSAFPGHPPYDGRHDTVVPHLTVAHEGGAALLHEVEEQVLAHLPIRLDVTEASLWSGTEEPGSWRRSATFPLG